MSRNAPDMGKLRLNDDIDEDLFASPESGATTQKHTPSSNTSSAQKQQSQKQSKQSKEDLEQARNAQLRAELEKIREVNKTIEGVTASLTKAKDNMSTVHTTVNNASTLLSTWTRILSQTEHNQRLLLSPSYQGATQDLEDMESEALRRQQESERRRMDDERRREEAQRRQEEEQRKREAQEAKSAGRGLGRTRSTRGGATQYTADGRRVTGSATSASRGRGSASGRGSIGGRGTTGTGSAGSGTRGRGRGMG